MNNGKSAPVIDYVGIVDALVRMVGGVTKVAGKYGNSDGAVKAGDAVLEISDAVRGPAAQLAPTPTPKDSPASDGGKGAESPSIVQRGKAALYKAWSDSLL